MVFSILKIMILNLHTLESFLGGFGFSACAEHL